MINYYERRKIVYRVQDLLDDLYSDNKKLYDTLNKRCYYCSYSNLSVNYIISFSNKPILYKPLISISRRIINNSSYKKFSRLKIKDISPQVKKYWYHLILTQTVIYYISFTKIVEIDPMDINVLDDKFKLQKLEYLVKLKNFYRVFSRKEFKEIYKYLALYNILKED